MAQLIIKRTQQWANKFRRIEVEINGSKTMELADGQEDMVELPAGKVQIRARISWTKSNLMEFHLSENETKVIQLGCHVEYGWTEKVLTIISFTVLFGTLFYYGEIKTTSLIILLILWIIRDLIITKGKSILYYLTFGRERYLYLKTLNERSNLSQN